jgi:Fe-Mn family superoxide dismutase
VAAGLPALQTLTKEAGSIMRVEFQPLPFAYDALEPHMSAATLRLHHDQHHRGYFDKLRELVADTEYADLDIETLIASTVHARGAKQRAIFNNAAQLWNHSFFWQSIAPGGGRAPADLEERMQRDFGGFAAFRDRFAEAAAALFGSGWVWLVERKGKLAILGTSNAGTPIADGTSRPLLTLDVWEHAYYLDHRNRRDQFTFAFLDHCANWQFAADRMRSESAMLHPIPTAARPEAPRPAASTNRA